MREWLTSTHLWDFSTPQSTAILPHIKQEFVPAHASCTAGCLSRSLCEHCTFTVHEFYVCSNVQDRSWFTASKSRGGQRRTRGWGGEGCWGAQVVAMALKYWDWRWIHGISANFHSCSWVGFGKSHLTPKKRGQLHCSSCRALPSFIIIAFQKFCAWETSWNTRTLMLLFLQNSLQ